MPGARRALALCLAVAVLAGGCAVMRQQEAQDTGALLAAAGFRIKAADTPARMEQLKAMPPLKLVQHVRDGKLVYSYADPYSCDCLYAGGPTEYQAYQRLAIQRQVAEDKRAAAEASEMSAMDWTMWGPMWW